MVLLVNCPISCCTICRIRLASGARVEIMTIPVELSFILWYLHAVSLPFLGECSLATSGYYIYNCNMFAAHSSSCVQPMTIHSFIGGVV